MTRQRRSTRWVVLGLAIVAVLALAACSDDDDNDATTTGSKTSSSSSQAASSSLDEAAAKAEITAAYKTFFDGSNPDDELKLQQLEDPEKARAVYMSTADANRDLLAGTQADVKSITFTDPETAEITFDLILNGTPALTDRIGNAVLVDGKWKITTTTFCDISSLGAPAVADDPACQ